MQASILVGPTCRTLLRLTLTVLSPLFSGIFQKDLIRRLRNVVHVLQTDDTIEPDSAEFPGLAATGTLLCQRYLNDRDKDVRLYSLLACMEILGIVRGVFVRAFRPCIDSTRPIGPLNLSFTIPPFPPSLPPSLSTLPIVHSTKTKY